MQKSQLSRRLATQDACSAGVTAAVTIPEGQLSDPFYEDSIALQFTRTLRDDRQVANFVSVRPASRRSQRCGADLGGILDDQGGLGWVARLQGARDCSEQNLELLLLSNSTSTTPPLSADEQTLEPSSPTGFRLRATREIRPGEQLLVWFSDASAMRMGIPVLSVLNIRAHHCYQCHLCQRKFLHPNVLKAHLMHACGVSGSQIPTQHQQAAPMPLPLPPPSVQQLQLQMQLQFQLQIQRGILEFAANHRVAPPPDLLTLLRRLGQLPLPPTLPPILPQPPQPPPQQQQQQQTASRQRHRRPWEEVDKTDEHLAEQHRPSQQPQSQHHCVSTSFDSISSITSTSTPASTPKKADAAIQQEENLHNRRDQLVREQELTKERHKQHQQQQQQQQQVQPTALDLPNDAEPLDLIPRSLYTCKSNKGHLCIYCGKVYSRKYGLKIHLRTHTGYKPLKCRVCLRPFGDPSNLNKHIRLHAEGDTPYRCEFCAKVLVRRRDLERHQRSRHPDRLVMSK